jgi:hypothetical protein
MKPIYLLDLTKLTADEIAGLRRDGFDVPPNIAGYKSYRGLGPSEWADYWAVNGPVACEGGYKPQQVVFDSRRYSHLDEIRDRAAR